jgi:hypothetical protein
VSPSSAATDAADVLMLALLFLRASRGPRKIAPFVLTPTESTKSVP